MSKYNVYGVGNALVDTEFEVEESFLTKMNVEKGLMTLVDQARQSELLEHLQGVTHKRTCGGSAANSMIAMAQLGGSSFYSCKVAADETGDFYYKDLQAEGVDSSLAAGREDGVTGKCFVFITPDADRTMNTYLGITETLSVAQLNEEALKASEFLYMEGYLVTSDTGRAAAIEARKMAEAHGVKTSITFSDPGIVAHFKAGLQEMIGNKVDFVFCNEAEALSFTGASDVKAAMDSLGSVANSFAITRGENGALVSDGGQVYEIPTQSVKAIDTNGAGDIFAGSFLYGLTHGRSIEESGRLACSAASRLVTQFGARLKKEQMQEVLTAQLN